MAILPLDIRELPNKDYEIYEWPQPSLIERLIKWSLDAKHQDYLGLLQDEQAMPADF